MINYRLRLLTTSVNTQRAFSSPSDPQCLLSSFVDSSHLKATITYKTYFNTVTSAPLVREKLVR